MEEKIYKISTQTKEDIDGLTIQEQKASRFLNILNKLTSDELQKFGLSNSNKIKVYSQELAFWKLERLEGIRLLLLSEYPDLIDYTISYDSNGFINREVKICLP